MLTSENSKTVLNFYPFYEDLIVNHNKFTTLRLGDRQNEFKIGDLVSITIGWDATKVDQLRKIEKATITSVKVKRINDLTRQDLEGESPDCQEKSAVKYVLGSIYRRVVKDDDNVTVIKWRYI